MLFAFVARAQEKNYDNTYTTTSGKVHFFSKTPLEDIEAFTQKAVGVFDTKTKKVQAKIPISTFDFKQKLMQEHFNENYLESDKYPYANLEGFIVEEIDYTKDGVREVTVKGDLTVHGVKKPRDIKVKITVKDGVPVNVVSEFNIQLIDHKIKIPKAVLLNIAEVIKVDLNFDLAKYEKK
jgi:polyisoprenoid-binding protein YceI